ncbi:DNA repair protein rhp26 [Basidiobolus ranarum]|uniref:DNA repair protein rhp26 n=1 Tax=Basidiobolus ranarum TaxID=34480 RepID=A0ABR2VTG9_9FUNG
MSEPEAEGVHFKNEQNISKVLGIDILDQDVLERNVIAEANKVMTKKDLENEKKRLKKTQEKSSKVKKQILDLENKLESQELTQRVVESTQKKLIKLESQLQSLLQDEEDIKKRLVSYEQKIETMETPNAENNLGESERERLIRTGKITPFSNLGGLEKNMKSEQLEKKSMTDLKRPALSLDDIELPRSKKTQADHIPTDNSDVDYIKSESEDEYHEESMLDLLQDELDDEDESGELSKNKTKEGRNKEQYRIQFLDDGDELHYQKRLYNWAKKRRLLRMVYNKEVEADIAAEEFEELLGSNFDPMSEATEPHPSIPDATFDGGFRVPGDIYANLFDYQKTCNQWLWELHCQEVGGIIGDEMGLGKTVQVISYLGALMYSGMLNKPTLIVCPATLLKQWVKEFHRWWPPMRVAILHSSGSGMSLLKGDAKANNAAAPLYDDDEDSEDLEDYPKRKKKGKKKKPESRDRPEVERLVERIHSQGHVLVTTYACVAIYRKHILTRKWGYVVLDEGHKIRNPDAEVTLACKQLKTPHRIILSGTPIQNNLTELWSLFDFVFPGRLGTLPVFQSQFAIPINLGGFANANNFQVQTAYKCACILRDLINPYLLRRMKVDVATDLPKKSEQVLFCRLTPQQREAYESFLKSNEMESIFSGRRHALFGIDLVRKICNHPDLTIPDILRDKNTTYGQPEKSGKMQVVKALLELWKPQQHRVLLFSQTRQMQDILEQFIKSLGYEYRRMDGTTPIQHRIPLVEEFNSREEIYVFLLTTKVGGLGLNLTSADRVIIFDPDWNPSTDMQARERAWRLGQKKEVTIFRLMTSGTIEEKIYHRQIFKQFLTNKILKDPKQKRFFQAHDLHCLFTLGTDGEETETGAIFAGTEIMKKKSPTKNSEKKNTRKELESLPEVASMEEYKFADTQANTTTNDADSQPSNNDEDRILSSLFELTGIHSALKHDTIMESARQEDIIVEQEANRIAERAVAALRESRKRRNRLDIGVPTWTGRSGTAGAAVAQPRFGQKKNPTISNSDSQPSALRAAPVVQMGSNSSKFGSGSMSGFRGNQGDVSSSSILKNLRERTVAEENKPSPTTSDLSPDSQEGLILKIRDYLYAYGGRASTSDIVSSFKLKIRGEEVPVFRKMLKSIATFEKDTSSGKGWWCLKGEFV